MTRRVIHRQPAVIIFVLLAGIAGCSSNAGTEDDGDDDGDDNTNGVCVTASVAADIWPGEGFGYISEPYITLLNDALFFQANDGVAGEELWRYDPAAGAAMLADIYPGSGASQPQNLTVLDQRLFFTAYDDDYGRELWVYDTANPDVGVSRLADIQAGSIGSFPERLIPLDGRLYFEADDGIEGRAIWVYDPESGVERVAGMPSGFDFEYSQILDGKIYFTDDDGVHGHELWSFDPAAGAELVADITPGSRGSLCCESLLLLDGKLYFKADDGTHGTELWVYEPATGARMVADINPGADSGYPSALTVLDGTLYFSANDGMHGGELWAYDPSMPASGATLVADINPGENGGHHDTRMTSHDGKLFFNGDDGIHGDELWVYDPALGASLIADFIPGIGGHGDDDPLPPGNRGIFDGKLYFSAYDSVAGRSTLWHYDAMSGPVNVSELVPGTGIVRVPFETFELKGKIYFSHRDEEHGRELWVYDPDCTP